MKTCTKCGIEQSISSFHKDRQKRDGLSCSCKSCKKKYQQNNPEIFKRAKMRYEKKHPENVKETIRKYQKNNPQVGLNAYHRRRARILGNKTYSISKKEMKKLYNSPCVYCGSTKEINADHVIPIARGGYHGIGNLAPACGPCNRRKHDSFIMEWRLRQRIPD